MEFIQLVSFGELLKIELESNDYFLCFARHFRIDSTRIACYYLVL